ncbi:IRK-interacting protein [Malania oleifera]|uniref:IRK-interacting protein n=1 Tax=Malania oleifera TaxID=397392 RepID=UPI0025AE2F9E|nr:IRK-interacting protein [Malania oleifera]
MAPPTSSSPSSSKPSPSPSLPTPLHHHFTPIPESEREEQEEEGNEAGVRKETSLRHHPTPIHHQSGNTGKKPPDTTGDDCAVSCNRCRPSGREKTSVVPLNNGRQSVSMASPNGIFRSILASLTWKSPKPSPDSSGEKGREEQWKVAVAELSHKLIQATRKRDEATLEASRLKHSMAELEKKLNKLELYCQNLKSGLDVCSNRLPKQAGDVQIKDFITKSPNSDKVIDHFLVLVSEARASVRLMSRSLTAQLRQMGLGGRVQERISNLLEPFDAKISMSKTPKSMLLYLEALLNRSFFEDFESTGFQKNAADKILNPVERCEANYSSFRVLRGLTWEEVLNKGTKHFSGSFSGFCDRKMSEIVGMLGWNRAWPEPLLQAFFAAAKAVWLTHLLATAVHPSLPIFRVDKGAKFDSAYMEDVAVGGGDKAQKMVQAMVRVMAAPGFYVYGNVVKCKVLCGYYSCNHGNESNGNDKGLLTTPSP